MKTYMSAQERNDFVLLMALHGKAHRTAIEWAEHDSLTKNELKNLRTGITWIGKVTTAVSQRMEFKFLASLQRDINGTDIFCMPKARAKIAKERYEKEFAEEVCEVNRQALEALAAQALYWCCECHCEGQEKADCPLRGMFTELAIPVYSEKQECPYEQIRDKKYRYKNLAEMFIAETGFNHCNEPNLEGTFIKDETVKELVNVFRWYEKNR